MCFVCTERSSKKPTRKNKTQNIIIYVCSVKMGIENTQGNYKAFKAFKAEHKII